MFCLISYDFFYIDVRDATAHNMFRHVLSSPAPDSPASLSITSDWSSFLHFHLQFFFHCATAISIRLAWLLLFFGSHLQNSNWISILWPDFALYSCTFRLLIIRL